jgi:hypothetical protein
MTSELRHCVLMASWKVLHDFEWECGPRWKGTQLWSGHLLLEKRTNESVSVQNGTMGFHGRRFGKY